MLINNLKQYKPFSILLRYDTATDMWITLNETCSTGGDASSVTPKSREKVWILGKTQRQVFTFHFATEICAPEFTDSSILSSKWETSGNRPLLVINCGCIVL